MDKTEPPISEVSAFEEPPPERIPKYDWASIREQLMTRPGKWAKVFDHDKNSLVTAIRIGSIPPMSKDRGIEIRTTNNTRERVRMCTMYARYNPDLDKESEK